MCNKNKTSLSSADQNLCEQYLGMNSFWKIFLTTKSFNEIFFDLDVQSFLNYMSLDNYTNFCLAYGFTARDFADGTLGLAWVAKPAGYVLVLLK